MKPKFRFFEKLEGYTFGGLSSKDQSEKEKLLSKKVEQIDLEKISSIDELVDAFGRASIQARNVGRCSEIFERMLADPDRPTIFLGLAGPLVAAGLRKVIRDMIEYNLVDCIVSTGAILYQDLYQACGFPHAVGTPDADDKRLRDLYIDRIYDTYVDEDRFWRLDCSVGKFADEMEPGRYSSRQFLELLGDSIEDPNSILGSAARHGIPVFSPAINDSSLGIGLTEHYHRSLKAGKDNVVIDSIRDNYELTQIVVRSPCTAAVYVAGGVPKNFINDAVVMAYIFGMDTGGHRYAIQVTTDSPHWGGLSGSTLSEATSWGKVSKKATHCMAFVEPSVSLPLIAGAMIKKGAAKKRTRLVFDWKPPVLTKLEAVECR